MHFWDDPTTVERFASRPPDHRLVRLHEHFDLSSMSVLDLGCAAGRNTVYAAQRDADIYAIDRSTAMVRRTRLRLEEIVDDAEQRVIQGAMENLQMFAAATFDLVIGLGIYQQAATADVWDKALSESARVLKTGGLCLVANFSPASRPYGEPLQAVTLGSHQYLNAHGDGGTMTLLSAEDLDAAFARFALHPFETTYTARRETELGFRVTVNGLYQKS